MIETPSLDIQKLTNFQGMITIGLNLSLILKLVEPRHHSRSVKMQQLRPLQTSRQISWISHTSLSILDLLFQIIMVISTLLLTPALVAHAGLRMMLFCSWMKVQHSQIIQIPQMSLMQRRSVEEKLFWGNKHKMTQMVILAWPLTWEESLSVLLRKKKMIRRTKTQELLTLD